MLFNEMLILMIIPAIAGIVMIIVWKGTGKKGKVKGALDDSWKSVAQERDTVIRDLVKEVDRQRGRANRALQMLESEEGNEESLIDPTILTEVAKKIGIAPEQITMLAEVPQIKKFLGKDPNKMIMQYAPILEGLLKKKQTTTSLTSEIVGM